MLGVGPRQLTPILMAVWSLSCTGGSPAGSPNYQSNLSAQMAEVGLRYDGVGDCYAGGTVFTFLVTASTGDTFGFSSPMDTGAHRIDQGYTSASLWRAAGGRLDAANGEIIVRHFNDDTNAGTLGADGELVALGPSFSMSGHWGCRLEE
jgi:hypothetical protein